MIAVREWSGYGKLFVPVSEHGYTIRLIYCISIMNHFSTALQYLERIGFDRPKLLQGLQASGGAFLALSIAWLLSLEHPQWAAITVFVTLQPTRGQLIEKSSYRFIGTVIGCTYGALVTWVAAGNLSIELSLLCLWSALMVFLGSLQRSYRSYGVLLAGYSALIVAALGPLDPDMVRETAIDRIITVFVGVTTAVIWSYLTKLQNASNELFLKTRRVTADILTACANSTGNAHHSDCAKSFDQFSILALLQDEIHNLTAEKKTAKARQIEHLIQALTNLLFAVNQHPLNAEQTAMLEKIAITLHGQNDFHGIQSLLRKIPTVNSDSVIEQALTTLMIAIGTFEDDNSPIQLVPEARKRYALDWVGAFQGAVRIFLVLAAISLIWIATNNPVFQYPLVLASISISLASTGSSPRRKMDDVIKGQTIAIIVALSTEALLWNSFPSALGQLLSLIPALLIFAFLRSHRSFSLSAPDYAISVFCLLTPGYYLYVETIAPVEKAGIAALGAILGYFAFLMVFPTDSRARRKALWSMIKQDVHQIALIPRIGISQETWRLSYCTRFLRITNWAVLEGGAYENRQITMQKGFVALRLAELVFTLRQLDRRMGLDRSLKRAIQLNLRRIAKSNGSNNKLIKDLRILEDRFSRASMIEHQIMVQNLFIELKSLSELRTKT